MKIVMMAYKTPGNSISYRSLRSLTANATSELDVLGHDGNPLGVNSAQVGVLEQTDEVSLGGLLEGKDSAALEAQVSLEVLSDFANQTLEGQLANQQLGALLVATDLTESDGTGSEPVGLLDSTSSGGRLAGGLGGELLAGSLSTSGLTSGLLSSSHVRNFSINPESTI